MTLYSHSRLGCFEQCPLRFKFNYIDKLETEIGEGVEAFLGTRVHEALEKLYTDVKFQETPTLQKLLDYFDSEWKKNWNDAIVIVRKQYNEENFRKMGEKFITDFYNRHQPFNQEKTVSTEKRVIIKLDGGFTLQGYIDRLSCNDGVYTIHDYKTANTLPTNDKLDTDRQLALYSIAVKQDYQDCKEVRLVWHYLAFDKEFSSSRTEEQIEQLKKDIINVIKKIESTTSFPAKASALCSWCQFQGFCPNFKHLQKVESLPPNEYLSDDGVKLVNEYAATAEQLHKIEDKLEQLREALLLYSNKEGSEIIYGSDIRALIKSYPRMSFPKRGDPRQKQFIEAIKQIGLWEDLSSVDVYELTKRINRKEIHEDLIKLLEKFITKSETTTVRLGKK
ncbi:MAG: PD-(D/E)XK nuclease family protein [bacterium]|nr:PD-(D/E)XK nuclease family protein [bacterium]